MPGVTAYEKTDLVVCCAGRADCLAAGNPCDYFVASPSKRDAKIMLRLLLNCSNSGPTTARISCPFTLLDAYTLTRRELATCSSIDEVRGSRSALRSARPTTAEMRLQIGGTRAEYQGHVDALLLGKITTAF